MTTIKGDQNVRTTDTAPAESTTDDASTHASQTAAPASGTTQSSGAPALGLQESFYELTDPGFSLFGFSPVLSLAAHTFNYADGLLGNIALARNNAPTPLGPLYFGNQWGRATTVTTDHDDNWRSLVEDHLGPVWQARGRTLTEAEKTLLAEVVANYNRLSTLDGVSPQVAIPDIKDIDTSLRDLRAALAHRQARLEAQQSEGHARTDGQFDDGTPGAEMPTAGQMYRPRWNDNLRSVVLHAYQDLFEGLDAEQADRRLQILMISVAANNDIRDVSLSRGRPLRLDSVAAMSEQVARAESSPEFLAELEIGNSARLQIIKATGTGALASLQRAVGREALTGTAPSDLDAALDSLSSDITVLRWDRAQSNPMGFTFFGFNSGFWSEFADDPAYDRGQLAFRADGQSDEEYIRANWPTTDEAAIQQAVNNPVAFKRLLMEKVGGETAYWGRSLELARTLGIDVTSIRGRCDGMPLADSLNHQVVEALHYAGIEVEWESGQSFESIMRQLKDHPNAELLEHLRTVYAIAHNDAYHEPGTSEVVYGPPLPEVAAHGVGAPNHELLEKLGEYASILEALEDQDLPPNVLAAARENVQTQVDLLLAKLRGVRVDLDDPDAVAAARVEFINQGIIKQAALVQRRADIVAFLASAPATHEAIDAGMLLMLSDAGFQVEPGSTFAEALSQLQANEKIESDMVVYLKMVNEMLHLRLTDPAAAPHIDEVLRSLSGGEVATEEQVDAVRERVAQALGKPTKTKVDELALLMASSPPPTYVATTASEAAPVVMAAEQSDPGGVIEEKQTKRAAEQHLNELREVAEKRTQRAEQVEVERDRVIDNVAEEVELIADSQQAELRDPNKRRGGPLNKG